MSGTACCGYVRPCRVLLLSGLMLTAGIADSDPLVAHQGHGGQPEAIDLSTLPAAYQVEGIGYCDGSFRVTTGDGASADFRDFNLLFKVDSGPHGPDPETPVLVPADPERKRAFIVVARPADLRDALARAC